MSKALKPVSFYAEYELFYTRVFEKSSKRGRFNKLCKLSIHKKRNLDKKTAVEKPVENVKNPLFSKEITGWK